MNATSNSTKNQLEMRSFTKSRTLLLVTGCLLAIAMRIPAAESGLPSSSNTITLPSHIQRPDGMFFLQAEIAGTNHLNFYLDTGAGLTAISEPLAKKLRKSGELRHLGHERMVFDDDGR